MRRFRRLAAACLVTTVMAGTAVASNGSLNEFKPKVMPVLVHVDSHGNVTEVSPSSALSPKIKRVLADSLDRWINQPGMTNGRPVNTAMIVNVALKTEPRADGKYDLSFAYVSSSASPFYSAHWASINGDQLALIDNTGNYVYDRGALNGGDTTMHRDGNTQSGYPAQQMGGSTGFPAASAQSPASGVARASSPARSH